MFNRRGKINLVLEDYFNILAEEYGRSRIFGMFLYGSQNYSLDDAESDIDCHGIIFPSFEDIVFNRPPVSKVIETEKGCIDVKDIRLFVDNMKKMAPQYLETITPYRFWYIENTFYEMNFEHYFSCNTESIYSYNPYKLYYNLMEGFKNKYDDFIKSENKNGKHLYHAIRFCDALQRITYRDSYYDIFDYHYHSDNGLLKDLKRNRVSETRMTKIAAEYLDKFVKLEDKVEKSAIKGWHDPSIEEKCHNEFLKKVFKKYLGGLND